MSKIDRQIVNKQNNARIQNRNNVWRTVVHEYHGAVEHANCRADEGLLDEYVYGVVAISGERRQHLRGMMNLVKLPQELHLVREVVEEEVAQIYRHDK